MGPAGGAGEEGCLKAGADTLGSVSKSSLAPITQMTTIAVHNFKWGTRFWQINGEGQTFLLRLPFHPFYNWFSYKAFSPFTVRSR